MSRDPSEATVAAGTATGSVWRRAGPAAGVALVALLLIFWPTTVFTVRFWESNGAYSHGYLIVPISLYLVWLQRAALAALTPRVQLWGLPLLFGLGLLWTLAHLVDVQLIMQLALLAAIGAMIWTLLGPQVTRRLLFPVGYLLLAIPVWSLLIDPLQELTAVATTRALQFVGVPVYLEAFYITIPSGQFVVEDVCAGLRYFLATLAISLLFAYLNFRRLALGALFVAAAMTISILMNWARVITIVYAGHVTSMNHFLVRDHIGFGWVMFVIALVPIFLIGIWLQRFDGKPAQQPAVPAHVSTRPPQSTPGIAAVSAAALLAVALGPVVLIAAAKPAPTADIHLQVPIAAAPWTIRAEPDSRWGPKFVAPDAQVLATFADGDTPVTVFIAYYARQRDGAELINEVNVYYDKHAWKSRAQSDRSIALADGATMNVREIELVAGNGDERLVWYWYRLGDRRTTNTIVAKLLQLWGSLTGTPGGAAIALSAQREASLADTRATLEHFLSNMELSLAAAVVRARVK